ncbi:ribonuclease P protein component [Marinimicrobium alkaliphilum]|uniref:ribonuclease P protein component n=1 Tax=Marinimicrobium alkaliphilum TaxID=2202654 RepID=UPI000DB9A8FC|nr:ribonuclease P protein component [Marinimicrobium alkaliphilum]
MSSHAFGKTLRLLNSDDFKSVFDDAPVRASHQHLLILARFNQRSHARLGLVIAKRGIRLAVQRNRIKRLIRESFRHRQAALSGLDIIVLSRPGLGELDNKTIDKHLNHQWQRLRKRAQKLADEAPDNGN